MTKFEKERAAKIAYYTQFLNDPNPGRRGWASGCIAELESVSKNSRKTAVSGANETDIYIHIDSKSVNIAAERKTNSARINALRLPDAPRYVVYSMRFVQKHKAGKYTEAYEELREIDPVVIPTMVFLAALDRFKATHLVKETVKSGRTGYAEVIQVSSKKFFEWLLDWPIPFDPMTVYTEDDFEGLE